MTAVTAAGLGETLSSAGPFTVFAPSNDAFAAVDPTVLAALLQPANKEHLVSVLKHHVVSGSVKSSALTNGQEVQTLDGKVTVGVTDAGVTVGGAKVIGADVMASNGVVHVIDAVLIPASVGTWAGTLSPPCPDNMINPMSCECGTETSNNNNGCPVTSCRSNCKQIEAAANVVTASLEVAGVKESDLVADKSMQTGIIKGFSTATGVGVSQIAITQIGTTKLNTRRLQDKLAIKFAITSDSPEGAKKLQAMVQSTSAADISNGIKAAGIAGVTATSSPTATVAESVTPVIAVTVTSSGLSDGEKAGIAIGVILGVVALGAAMFLCKPASPSKNEYQNKPVQASQTESSLSGYGQ